MFQPAPNGKGAAQEKSASLQGQIFHCSKSGGGQAAYWALIKSRRPSCGCSALHL
jgi:hypothetical protein